MFVTLLAIPRSKHTLPPQTNNAGIPPPDPSPVVVHLPALRRAINDSLSLLYGPIAVYQQEHYWTHHTRAALESALTSTIEVEGLITLSTDADGIASNGYRIHLILHHWLP